MSGHDDVLCGKMRGKGSRHDFLVNAILGMEWLTLEKFKSIEESPSVKRMHVSNMSSRL